jgi:hypothetical protein
MAQHLWHELTVALSVGRGSVRLCEVCAAGQFGLFGEWGPEVNPICPGDPDGGGRRRVQPLPHAPSGNPIRVLEDA